MPDIFQFSTSSISDILAYTGNLIGNVMPLLVVIIGIGLALWILDHFLRR